MPEIYTLNSKQKEAIETTEGPVLVIAGAGAGKTKVITERIKYLITKGVEPANILAVTFTNKAAEEMRDRVGRGDIFIGTFHSLGLLLIRENLKNLGIKDSKFTILDEDDSLKLLKECVLGLGLDPKQFEPAKLKNHISTFKNQLITQNECIAENFWSETLCKTWNLYEEKKTAQSLLDFDDLILKPTLLLRNNRFIRKKYQDRWQYIHIDEYQDTNEAQYVLSKILSEVHKNIFSVGDIDQAIYSWRGADFRNILSFKADYPEAQVITLEENYRSTSAILDAANAIILNNKLRVPKKLWTSKKGGNKIEMLLLRDEKKEADVIAQKTDELLKFTNPAGIAVLYRTNAQSRALEEAMLKHNIPYRIIGGVKFYERREIKDILAYAKLAQNQADSLNKKRIENVPPRKRKGINFDAVMNDIRIASVSKPPDEFIKHILAKIGYKEYIDDGTEKGKERWQNVLELVSLAKKITAQGGGLEKFLEHVSLFEADPVNKRGSSNNKVSLMTIHSAKGLEFDAVFVAGMEEGLMPHSLSIEPEKLEEERRLCYVALTRARSHLYLTLAIRRFMMGERVANMPSRFLRELPEHLIDSRFENSDDEENEIIIE